MLYERGNAQSKKGALATLSQIPAIFNYQLPPNWRGQGREGDISPFVQISIHAVIYDKACRAGQLIALKNHYKQSPKAFTKAFLNMLEQKKGRWKNTNKMVGRSFHTLLRLIEHDCTPYGEARRQNLMRTLQKFDKEGKKPEDEKDFDCNWTIWKCPMKERRRRSRIKIVFWNANGLAKRLEETAFLE
jgi:hypothetical protein